MAGELERMLVGAVLGAGIASGKAANAGGQFLLQFLKPLSRSQRAQEFIARALYTRETSKSWEALPTFDQDIWYARARTALEAMTQLVVKGIAGVPKHVSNVSK